MNVEDKNEIITERRRYVQNFNQELLAAYNRTPLQEQVKAVQNFTQNCKFMKQRRYIVFGRDGKLRSVVSNVQTWEPLLQSIAENQQDNQQLVPSENEMINKGFIVRPENFTSQASSTRTKKNIQTQLFPELLLSGDRFFSFTLNNIVDSTITNLKLVPKDEIGISCYFLRLFLPEKCNLTSFLQKPKEGGKLHKVYSIFCNVYQENWGAFLRAFPIIPEHVCTLWDAKWKIDEGSDINSVTSRNKKAFYDLLTVCSTLPLNRLNYEHMKEILHEDNLLTYIPYAIKPVVSYIPLEDLQQQCSHAPFVQRWH